MEPSNHGFFSDDQFAADPHSIQARTRAEAPVHQVLTPDGRELWIITRYDDARTTLADQRLSKSVKGDSFAHMLNSDPPDHTRMRGLLTTSFTPQRVERLRPRITEITDELLDAMAGRNEVDLVEDFAFPLAITVICELLGAPTDNQAALRAWATALTSGRHDETSANAGRSMAHYLTELLETKRSDPADDLLSHLAHVTDTGRLTRSELLSTAVLLVIAGHETTANLICNGVLGLLRHPDQLEMLRTDPRLIPAAVDELLRFDGPVTLATHRITTEPIEIDGIVIPEAKTVHISLSSANRDPEKFPDPDRVDLTRSAAGHLAFGHGIHHCLGTHLARLEADIAFTGLLNRFPEFQLAVDVNELIYRPSLMVHGLRTLPLLLHPTSDAPRAEL